MSEDVKPRKVRLSSDVNNNWIVVLPKSAEGPFPVDLIELDPTLQLMKDMGEAIINEVRLDSKEEILEKYRKFLEGINEQI